MKILLAIDDSKFSEAATQFLATQFRPQDSQVMVLYVVEPIAISEPPQMSPGYYPELEDQVREARIFVERAGRTLCSAGFEVSTRVAEGDAKSVILDEAVEWHVELIVLGSHGRKGLQRFLLGSVAEAIARHAPCHVLIVRMPA
jgi:nucleotide-binding universal stress UspA family protein